MRASLAELIGYVAAPLVFLTFYIKMMTPLRIVAISSNCAFITYGYLDGLHPILVLHIILLPLNMIRLYQMIRLTQQVREAAHGDLNMDWIKPFSTIQQVRVGGTLFQKNEPAKAMFVIVSGRFRLEESGIDIGPGNVVGELSLLSPSHMRTQTLSCVESGKVLRMNVGQVEQLFFQNQEFGYSFLRLIVSRLFKNIEALERALAEQDREILRLQDLITEPGTSDCLLAIRKPRDLLNGHHLSWPGPA